VDPLETFKAIGMSLGLGLLVGLQREHAESQVAGIRTFALVTLLGTLMAMLGQSYGGWLVAVGALCVAVLLFVANLAKMRRGLTEPGLTTEIAALVMYGIGAYLVLGDTAVAVLAGGIVAVLLQFKQPMHAFVNQWSASEIRSVMQFVLLAMVILPVLPNENYGPFGAFNPHETWLMVVLIVGISVAGYIAYKLFGQRAGTLLGGCLGGLVSSTATTASYARRTAAEPCAVRPAVLVIAIASAVSVARVIVEVSVAASPILAVVGPPLVVMLAWMLVLALAVYRFGNRQESELPAPQNPAELKMALVFGALYVAIKLAVATTQHYLGGSALYGVAVLSGLTDLDALTLSTSKLVQAEQLTRELGWRLILVGVMSNLAFKTGIVAVLGHRRLARDVGLIFGAAIAGGALILWFWTGDWVSTWLSADGVEPAP
jgi:uncharacterized membrane protein (DUF4010 family)